MKILIAFLMSSFLTIVNAGTRAGNGIVISPYGFQVEIPAKLTLKKSSEEDFTINNAGLVSNSDPVSSIEFIVLPGTFANLSALQSEIELQEPGIVFLPIQFSTGPGFYHLDRTPGHVSGQYYLLIENNRAVEAKLDAYSAGEGLQLVGSIMGTVASPSGEPVAIEPIPNPEPTQFIAGSSYTWKVTDTFSDGVSVTYEKLEILAIQGNVVTIKWSNSNVYGQYNLGYTTGQFYSDTGLAIAVFDIDPAGTERPNISMEHLPMFSYYNLPGLIQHTVVHIAAGHMDAYSIGDSSTNYPVNLVQWTGEDAGPFRGCLLYESDPSNTGPSFGIVTELIQYAQ
jgi:hypothetical protein